MKLHNKKDKEKHHIKISNVVLEKINYNKKCISIKKNKKTSAKVNTSIASYRRINHGLMMKNALK
jgi:hypothetical protein